MPAHSPLPAFAQADLERFRLATEILLRLAEDDILSASLEAELVILRDRVEHALLAEGGDR
jgi:hypothetical protein